MTTAAADFCSAFSCVLLVSPKRAQKTPPRNRETFPFLSLALPILAEYINNFSIRQKMTLQFNYLSSDDMERWYLCWNKSFSIPGLGIPCRLIFVFFLLLHSVWKLHEHLVCGCVCVFVCAVRLPGRTSVENKINKIDDACTISHRISQRRLMTEKCHEPHPHILSVRRTHSILANSPARFLPPCNQFKWKKKKKTRILLTY